MYRVRPAAIAGSFYPGLKQVLQQDVSSMLADAAHAVGTQAPKAIIVPHAGYMYSGQIAAEAYARLADARMQIKRVVLLGPVHRVPVRGLALPEADAFATPLGEVMLDQEAVQAISGMPQVVVNGAAHALEHSLEVQLPFLQSVLDDFKLVPLAVGDANAEEVAGVLDALWGGKETLIVISSDLSHFLPYHIAQKIDQQTAQRIVDMHGPISHEQACGGTPINGFLLSARRHHLRSSLLDLRNSGDTAGDKGRVVGYAAFAFMEDTKMEDTSNVH